jgi:hypothetical protein
MKNVSDFVMMTAQAAVNTGAAIGFRLGEDTIRIMPVTTGSTNMTLVIEELNPDGVTWHNLATSVLTTVGQQTPIFFGQFIGRAIRARVSIWTSGTITVSGYAGTYGTF